jgi:photosystem II stability/assembly factor-like uncharacterized protein
LPIDPSTAFVSYAREDLEFVLRLTKDLKAKGAKVWMDKLDLRPGQRWDSEVEVAVDGCSRMLVVLSPAAVASQKVTNEFMAALDEGKIVIPVLFRECRIPLQLRRLQYADFRADYAVGLEELLMSMSTAQEPVDSAIPDQPRLEEERKHAAEEQARRDQEERDREAADTAPLAQARVEAKPGEREKMSKRLSARTSTPQFPKLIPRTLLAVATGCILVLVLVFMWPPRYTWKSQKSGTHALLRSAVFVSPQSGWAVGDDGTILHTEDGGNTWKLQSPDKLPRDRFSGKLRPELFSVAFNSPMTGVAVGNWIRLWTDDGGNSWKLRESEGWLGSVTFVSPQSGWAVGVLGIQHTNDGGNSWLPVANVWAVRELLSVSFVSPYSGWTVGASGIVVHTDDGGNSWQIQTSGTDKTLNSVAFVSVQSGWAVGDGGTILHTDDGGNSWKPQKSGTQQRLNSVAFVSPQSGWAVGDGGTILHTDDGGSSWKRQPGGAGQSLFSVAFVSPESGWAVGDNGTILHFSK